MKKPVDARIETTLRAVRTAQDAADRVWLQCIPGELPREDFTEAMAIARELVLLKTRLARLQVRAGLHIEAQMSRQEVTK